jgi:hypothetical protein
MPQITLSIPDGLHQQIKGEFDYHIKTTQEFDKKAWEEFDASLKALYREYTKASYDQIQASPAGSRIRKIQDLINSYEDSLGDSNLNLAYYCLDAFSPLFDPKDILNMNTQA